MALEVRFEDFLNSTWIGSWNSSDGGDSLIVHISPIGEIQINIVGHSIGTGSFKAEGNVLYMTIHRTDRLIQAFTCSYTDESQLFLRGFYVHYNSAPISTTPMNLRRVIPRDM
jgi:hypothetical protein